MSLKWSCARGRYGLTGLSCREDKETGLFGVPATAGRRFFLNPVSSQPSREFFRLAGSSTFYKVNFQQNLPRG